MSVGNGMKADSRGLLHEDCAGIAYRGCAKQPEIQSLVSQVQSA